MTDNLTPPARWVRSKATGSHEEPVAKHVKSRIKTSGRTVGVDGPVGSAGMSGPEGIPAGIKQVTGIKPRSTGDHLKPIQKRITPRTERRPKVTRSTPEHKATRVI